MRKWSFLFLCWFSLAGLSGCTPVQTQIQGASVRKAERSSIELQMVIQSHFDELRRIHRELYLEGKLGFKEGIVIFQFEILPDGSVGQIKVTKNTFYPDIGEVIGAEIKNWKFSAIESSLIQTIEVPLAFTAE
ncbi:MAG: hypothetical protein L6Q77_08955 [Bacteroidetes bacterium]|nr:hypothetical protein [Bacteroidota bacterium]